VNVDRDVGASLEPHRLALRSLGAPPVGVFLVLRRMSLMGDAMSHAILPGAAIGYLLAGLSLFAMSAGGGVDLNLNRRFAIRAQGAYLMTRFLDLRQDNLQFSSGLVVHFGRK